MGKPILYCGDCGRSLREEDFTRLKAGYLQNSPYCVECCPNVVLSTPPHARQASAFPSSTRVRSISTTSSTPSKALPATFAAAIGGALVMVAIIAALSTQAPPRPAPAPVVRAAAPAPTPPPEPEPPPPHPRPVNVKRVNPEPPPPPAEAPAAVLERYLGDIRAIRENDTAFKRADEIRSMLKRAAEIAGPRKAEVVALLAAYEKEIAVPAKPPAAVPAAKPARKGDVVNFTLMDADTEKPVPGYDPLALDATINLGKLGVKKIDVRVNTAPRDVGSIETVIDAGATHVENSFPYSFTTNSVAAGYTGWTPTAGRHTLKCRIWSEPGRAGQAGPWVTISFTIVDPR